MTLRLAYNTNGWPQHELGDVATQLAALGYAGDQLLVVIRRRVLVWQERTSR